MFCNYKYCCNVHTHTYKLLEVYFQGIFSEAEFLGRRVTIYVILLGIVQFLSMEILPFCICASSSVFFVVVVFANMLDENGMLA